MKLNLKKTGKNVRRKRIKMGLTQAMLAAKVNCTQEQISHYENGLVENPPHKMLTKFSEYLIMGIWSFYDK